MELAGTNKSEKPRVTFSCKACEIGRLELHVEALCPGFQLVHVLDWFDGLIVEGGGGLTEAGGPALPLLHFLLCPLSGPMSDTTGAL